MKQPSLTSILSLSLAGALALGPVARSAGRSKYPTKIKILLVLSAFCFLLYVSSYFNHRERGLENKFTANRIKGSYSYSLQGDMTHTPPEFSDSFAVPVLVAASGFINIHWRGNPPSELLQNLNFAEVDANGERNISLGGESCTLVRHAFECDLEIEPDGTGSATCISIDPDPPECAFPLETFDFVFEDKNRGFRFLGTSPGFVTLGVLAPKSTGHA